MLLALKTVLAVPSPQLTVTCPGPSAPGSVKEPRVKALLVPSLARLVGWCADRGRDIADRHLERSVIAAHTVVDRDGGVEDAVVA